MLRIGIGSGAAIAQNRVFTDLFSIAANADLYHWEKLRDGVEIYYLYQTLDGPSAALIKYAVGAQVPLHTHQGYEHIFVLNGSQSDDVGDYQAGTLAINAPGSQHRVKSPQGCIVLAIWERPVAFLSHE